MTRLLALLACLATPLFAAAQEPWATYRGNSQRTGSTDNQPVSDQAKVLWALKGKDHYVAAAVPLGDKLFVSALGAFNVPTFSALSTDIKAANRTLWTKSTPSLKLPTVSSPAIAGGRLIFGDGMHQTDGAVLHCVEADGGFPVWQYPVPGNLVHLEGSPTALGNKIYIGGGAAGALCIDGDALTFEGKPLDAAAIKKTLGERWKGLLAKYDDEKKKNPDFAVPPSEDQLPRALPTLVWQQGKEAWHVDAPVAVAKGKVLVASAFLDKEKVGDRALICLDAATGKIEWKKPLKLNPWGGPTVAGDIVVVSGSTIGYDPAKLKGAKGFIAAFKLSDGAELWSKEITGGVLSCVAVGDGAAVITATDGKVRAFDLQTGERKWIYDAKVPLFAPPAIAKNRVIVGDLKGAIHSIDLESGDGKWIIDLGNDPATKAPGMVYGGPIVSGGRVYVTTCNLEGPYARQETVVACIGEK